MPYPNEHAARIRDPGSFIPDSFRSKNLKGGVRLIIGKLKTGGDGMVTQAYRFSVDDFTPEEARKWLKDNKISFIKFESAEKESEMTQSDELKHVGVLGMRWGVRRDRSGGSSSRSGSRRLFGKKKEKPGHQEHEEVSKLKKKKIKDMSNQELEKVAKRLELEKRYRNVNPTRTQKGSRAVSSTFKTMGTLAGTVATITTLAAAGKKIFDYYNKRAGG